MKKFLAIVLVAIMVLAVTPTARAASKESLTMGTGGESGTYFAVGGVLAVGKKADVVAVDMDRPHLTPCIDTLSNLLYSAQAADVCLTMVDGRVLYEDGTFYTLDRERILFEARRAAARLMG